MNSILFIFILWMLLKHCTGAIIVENKQNKKLFMNIGHDLLLSGLDEPLLKVQLHFVQLSTSCSIPAIPQSKSYSVIAENVRRPTILVIHEHNEECDINEIILNAKSTGHCGIIFCVDAVKGFPYIEPVIGFYISVILNSSIIKISNLDATRYKVSIFRDTNILQDLWDHFGEYFYKALPWFIRSDYGFLPGTQSFILLIPSLMFLLATHCCNSKKSRGEWEYTYNEYRGESSDSKDNLFKHRQILNVGPDATRQVIKESYRDLVLVYHPDKNMHLQETARLKKKKVFLKIQEAKEALLKSLDSSPHTN